MPPLIKTGDQFELVSTQNFPLGKFPFENFNPVQSRLFEYYDKDCNCIIAAATSSGKTVIAELVLSYEIRVKEKKGVYVCPLRALAQEKYDEWTSQGHHFADLNISICTGDYQLTDKRKKELDDANLIIITAEMLNSRVRNLNSEKSKFLFDVGTLVVDEQHLLSAQNRGVHLEVGLMNFTEVNKDSRIVGLSATMPNVDEIASWISYVLNKKETILISSTYRPCPLYVHFEKYTEGGTYDQNEYQKVNLALDIVEYYPEDKFLIFAHTKRTGQLMKKMLYDAGIESEFHNADLTKQKRIDLENRFKKDKNFRVIIATSSLSQGINLPARRVIILGIHRGLEEVANYDIHQECGRAGRPLYDSAGDAYVLLPEKKFDFYREKLRKPHLIKSQMLEQKGGQYKVLGFHIVSEIHQEHIQSKADVKEWFKRTLACWQTDDLPDEIVHQTLDSLKKAGAIWEENNKITVTGIGKVASMFYFSPYDVSDLKKNFTLLFDEHKENDDYWISVALGNLDTHRFGIVSNAERQEMGSFTYELNLTFSKGGIWEPAIKSSFAYYLLLNGSETVFFNSICRNFQFDSPRLMQVLQALDSLSGKWGKRKWFDELELRLKYGVKGHLVNLCRLPHIGKARAGKLYNAGFKSLDAVISNPAKLRTLLKFKPEKIEEILTEARKLSLFAS